MAKKATKVTFDKELFKKEVENNVKSLFRITFKEADSKQIFKAAAYAVQDLIVDNWMKTQDAYEKEDPKTVYYLSMEFLMGRAFGNNMINLQAYEPIKEVLEEMGVDINVIEDQEPHAALGNGGLVVWQLVLLTLWQHLVTRLTVVVSVTATVCSSSRSATVIR